jgi:hypothetical protein
MNYKIELFIDDSSELQNCITVHLDDHVIHTIGGATCKDMVDSNFSVVLLPVFDGIKVCVIFLLCGYCLLVLLDKNALFSENEREVVKLHAQGS